MDIVQLVEAARAGDQRAWGRLAARLWPRLRGWFVRRVSCCDADELVQDTLVVMWKKLPNFELRCEEAFISWAFRIAHFMALEALRDVKRETKLAQALGQVQRTPSAGLNTRVERAERIALIAAEIDKMSHDHRRAIENMLAGGGSRDLAAQAGIKFTTARSVQSRACARLRQRLGPSSSSSAA